MSKPTTDDEINDYDVATCLVVPSACNLPTGIPATLGTAVRLAAATPADPRPSMVSAGLLYPPGSTDIYGVADPRVLAAEKYVGTGVYVPITALTYNGAGPAVTSDLAALHQLAAACEFDGATDAACEWVRDFAATPGNAATEAYREKLGNNAEFDKQRAVLLEEIDAAMSRRAARRRAREKTYEPEPEQEEEPESDDPKQDPEESSGVSAVIVVVAVVVAVVVVVAAIAFFVMTKRRPAAAAAVPAAARPGGGVPRRLTTPSTAAPAVRPK